MELQTVYTLRSSLIWVCIVCPDLSVRKLKIITVAEIQLLYYFFTLEGGKIKAERIACTSFDRNTFIKTEANTMKSIKQLLWKALSQDNYL